MRDSISTAIGADILPVNNSSSNSNSNIGENWLKSQQLLFGGLEELVSRY